MKICGPKLSLCGLIISVWGIIQLVSVFQCFLIGRRLSRDKKEEFDEGQEQSDG